jgi:hypothetical protein
VFPRVGVEGRDQTSSVTVMEPVPRDFVGDATVLEISNSKEEFSIHYVIDESLNDFIPSYRDVLSHTLLSIFMGGNL